MKIIAALCGIFLLTHAHFATAQKYPVKPIRIVVGGVGGGSDFVARLIAPELSSSLGQQIIVDNRGGGVFAGEIVSKASPDGYTLLFYGSNIWLAPFLRDHVQYDPVKDLAPITLAVSAPNIVVVHPALPVKSVAELIALANAKPGEINYATGPAGSATHLAADLFKSMAGIRIVRIPYKGNGPGLNALLGDEVQLMFPSAGATVAPHLRSGRLKALAVTSAQPSRLYPGLPTVAASGLPGYAAVSILGVFAPAGTPTTLADRLHGEFVRALGSADVKERLLNAGQEPIGSTPGELAATIKSEMAMLGKIIRQAGIRAD